MATHPKPDPLAAALDAATPSSGGHHQFKLDILFGDRPTVLASIVAAFKRGLGYETIARILSKQEQTVIAPTAVKSWLNANGHFR
jgi:hypothetical protein